MFLEKRKKKVGKKGEERERKKWRGWYNLEAISSWY